MDETTGAAVSGLSALTRLTGADVFGNVDVLANPERKSPHERPCLGSAKVASERSVMALPKHLRAKAPTSRDTEAIRRPLPSESAVQEAVSH